MTRIRSLSFLLSCTIVSACFLFLICCWQRECAAAADPDTAALSSADTSGSYDLLANTPLNYEGFVSAYGGFSLHSRLFERFETELHGRMRLGLELDESQKIVFSGDFKNRQNIHENTDNLFDTDVELYEVYWDYLSDHLALRLGKQMITWGRSDEIIPLDLVNPQDLTRFFVPYREDRKIPVWMTNVEWYADQLSINAVWVPFFTSSRIADPGWDWAPAMPAVPPAIEMGGHLIPAHIRCREEDIENRIRYSQYGLKLTWQAENSIFDVIYYNGRDPVGVPETAISLDDNGIWVDIQKRHPNVQVLGAAFSTVFGKFVLRGDAAFYFDKYISTKDYLQSGGLARKNYVVSCLGIDYSRQDEIYANILLQNNMIIDHETHISKPRSETIVFGILDRYWNNKIFKARLLFYYNIDEGDSRLNPEFSYEISDGFNACAGLELLNGDAGTDWGQYSDNDLFYLKFQYFF